MLKAIELKLFDAFFEGCQRHDDPSSATTRMRDMKALGINNSL